MDPESEQRNRPDETSASVQPAGLEWEGGGRSETEEADAYAAAQRRDIMMNVGVVFDLSERAEQETYALLDLDGDGTAEKLLLRSRMAQAVNEVDHSPLDQYIFAVNTMRGETRTAQNLGNSIYAFTPNGRQILLALMRRDEFGQYESFLFRYENGELQEAGSFAQDIREIWVENGQIITNQPMIIRYRRKICGLCTGSEVTEAVGDSRRPL